MPTSPPALCECGKPIKHPLSSKCATCYQRRWYREHRATPPVPANLRYDAIGYKYAHQKVQRYRGKATEYHCAHGASDHPAEEWAYKGRSKYELSGWALNVTPAGTESQKFLRWSPDIEDYIPLCRVHHIEMDRG